MNAPLPRVATGIEGLDEILGAGRLVGGHDIVKPAEIGALQTLLSSLAK